MEEDGQLKEADAGGSEGDGEGPGGDGSWGAGEAISTPGAQASPAGDLQGLITTAFSSRKTKAEK